MKSFLAAIALIGFVGTPVVAAPRIGIDAPHYTCEGGGLSRVAAKQAPAPCCAGQFGCPQLLSNTGLVKPKHSNRT